LLSAALNRIFRLEEHNTTVRTELLAGHLLTAVLMTRKVTGDILLGVILVALAGIPIGVTHWPAQFFSLPHPSGTFPKLDFSLPRSSASANSSSFSCSWISSTTSSASPPA
jgi:AGZA family xanthine/uracil permease-like MFS transporter